MIDNKDLKENASAYWLAKERYLTLEKIAKKHGLKRHDVIYLSKKNNADHINEFKAKAVLFDVELNRKLRATIIRCSPSNYAKTQKIKYRKAMKLYYLVKKELKKVN